MNDDQFKKAKSGAGFIAALDQSGGSTPKASQVSMTMFLGTGPILSADELGMKSIG